MALIDKLGFTGSCAALGKTAKAALKSVISSRRACGMESPVSKVVLMPSSRFNTWAKISAPSSLGSCLQTALTNFLISSVLVLFPHIYSIFMLTNIYSPWQDAPKTKKRFLTARKRYKIELRC